MEEIRVVQWGLGAMGSGMAKLILEKPRMRLVGAIDKDPSKVGKDLGEVLDLGRRTGTAVMESAEDVIASARPDVVIIATSSFVKDVMPQITCAVRHKANVICIAEEMAFAAAQSPDEAAEMDALARENGVTILGTGINPGFILDTLIIALTGVCARVERIRARRVNDLSPFGPTVMKTQGVGTTPEEFEAGLKSGEIVGHVGFPESMHMIASALGWKLDRIEQTREPIISRTERKTKYIEIKPGMVAGCNHVAHGFVDGREVITLEHPQQVVPSAENVETGDYIWIEGTPSINLAIKPEIPGGTGTIAIAVNMIPHVVAARPGLLSMKDLPVPAALMGSL